MIVFEPTFRVSEQLNDPPCTFAGMPSQVTAETPDNPSEMLPVTVTPGVGTVAPLEGEVMLSEGGVLSRLIVTDALDWFPAVSDTVPLITWPAPSVDTVWDAGHWTPPERLVPH